MSTRTVDRQSATETIQTALGWVVDRPEVAVVMAVGVLLSNLDAAAVSVGEEVALLAAVAGTLATIVADGVANVYGGRLALGESPALGDTIGSVLTRVPALIAVTILYGVAVLVGFLFLIIPGVYLGLRLYLAFPACVIDEQGPIESLGTSWDAAHGNLLKLFGMGLVVAVVGFVGLIALLAVGIPLSAGSSQAAAVALGVATLGIAASLRTAYELGVGRVYVENTTTGAASPANSGGDWQSGRSHGTNPSGSTQDSWGTDHTRSDDAADPHDAPDTQWGEDDTGRRPSTRQDDGWD